MFRTLRPCSRRGRMRACSATSRTGCASRRTCRSRSSSFPTSFPFPTASPHYKRRCARCSPGAGSTSLPPSPTSQFA
eukprot:4502654-Pleurochrysis_carterae.AAC.1